MIRRLLPLCLLLAAISISPATANGDDRNGIAFAYAAEQGMGVCVGGSPEKAMSCARAKCTESGARPEDCARIAWCFPSGWSAGVGIMHKEGIHWSEFTCGWPTKEAAIAAGKVRCDHQDKTFITECSVGVLYDPEGKEVPAE